MEYWQNRAQSKANESGRRVTLWRVGRTYAVAYSDAPWHWSRYNFKAFMPIPIRDFEPEKESI